MNSFYFLTHLFGVPNLEIQKTLAKTLFYRMFKEPVKTIIFLGQGLD